MLRRHNRILSETKPEGIKAATWALIQGANARRRSLLAGRGNVAKARALARYLWSIKDELASEPRIAGPTPAAEPEQATAERIRFGAPLRNIPSPFTRKSFS